jgi:type III pantothenate kinase
MRVIRSRLSLSFLLLWCLQESNQGHIDFQSIALPTELRHQPHLRRKDNNLFCFAIKAKYFFSDFLYYLC